MPGVIVFLLPCFCAAAPFSPRVVAKWQGSKQAGKNAVFLGLLLMGELLLLYGCTTSATLVCFFFCDAAAAKPDDSRDLIK